MFSAAYTFWYHGTPDTARTPPASLAQAIEQAQPMLYPGKAHQFAADEHGRRLTRSPHTFTNPGWTVTLTPQP